MTELTRIRKYMQKLREDRDQEIQTVKQSLRDAEAGIRDAETRKDQASRVTDLSAYQEAEKDLEAARTKRNMYSERLHQLQDLDFVTDQESEKTINSILAYEQTIGTQIDERIRSMSSPLIICSRDTKTRSRTQKGPSKTGQARFTRTLSARGPSTQRPGPITAKIRSL